MSSTFTRRRLPDEVFVAVTRSAPTISATCQLPPSDDPLSFRLMSEPSSCSLRAERSSEGVEGGDTSDQSVGGQQQSRANANARREPQPDWQKWAVWAGR